MENGCIEMKWMDEEMTSLKTQNMKKINTVKRQVKEGNIWEGSRDRRIMRTVETMLQMQATHGRAPEATTEKKTRAKVRFLLSRQKIRFHSRIKEKPLEFDDIV